MAVYEIHHLGLWTDPVTVNRTSCSAFKASWSKTIDDLEYEAEKLRTRLIMIDVDVERGDLRLDGLLKADAKVKFPGVRVHLVGTKHGDLTYATDQYRSLYSGDTHKSWQANVRAIALSLEALRSIDRWGVTKRGEQYTGWKALPSGAIALPAPMTEAEALRLIFRVAEMTEGDIAVAYRNALARTHPDRDGSRLEEWHQVQTAGARLGL